MNKKGFTLIELLAVIIILAVIALIVTPMIQNIITDSRKGVARTSISEYVHSVDQLAALQSGDLNIISDFKVPSDSIIQSGDPELDEIKYNGEGPTYVYMEFSSDKSHLVYGEFCQNGYSINYIEGSGVVDSDDEYCKGLEPGLYSKNGEFTSWDDLVALGLNIEADFSSVNIEGTTEYTYAPGSGSQILKDNNLKGRLVLPDTITRIGRNNFYKDENNTIVRISNSVKTIAASAFIYSNLTSVNIPGTVETIETTAFYGIKTLEKLVLRSGIKTIGRAAFGRSGNNIESITIPDGIENLTESAFMDFQAKKVVFSDGIENIPSRIFEHQIADSEPKVETVVLGPNVKTIGVLAFSGQSNLKNINLPNSLKRIDTNAFNKTGLSEVILPDGVEELGNFAFQKMDSLTKIYVPGTITTMGQFSFGNNPNLTDVVLGEGLQKIGASMFENCTSLKSINLPSTLLTIELGGFYNSGLESIDIPNGVISIGIDAFMNDKALKSVTIPGSVKEIGQDAFRYTFALETLTLSEGLEIIGQSAFSTNNTNPSPLKNIVIPSTVTSMGAAPFNNRTNLETVTFTDTVGWKAGDTSIDVSNPSTNATNLSTTYRTALWTKN